jgi:hypothetical protein
MYPWPADRLICPTAYEQITIDFLFRGPGSGLWNCTVQFQQNGSHSRPEARAFAVSSFIEFESLNSATCGVAGHHAGGESSSGPNQRDATGVEESR